MIPRASLWRSVGYAAGPSDLLAQLLEGEFSEHPLNRVSQKFILSAVSLSALLPVNSNHPSPIRRASHPDVE
jgi:hypothetical protein